ncbi:MAG TPA: hypothetical protein VGJ52_02050, partial [Vicinamibacterales bacterium]
GFSTVFCTMVEGHLAILARRNEEFPTAWERMPGEERRRREKRYRVAADLAVLQMPEPVRTRVARDWDDALARSIANGTAEIPKSGRIKLRPPKDAKG